MQTATTNPGEGKDEVKEANAKNGIENHKQAANHHQEAAKHHLDAAKHHEAGNHEKAHESAVLANGHATIASDFEKEDAKQHALNTK